MKIKVNDIELYYEMHGEGEPIIFSHGCAIARYGTLKLSFSLKSIQ